MLQWIFKKKNCAGLFQFVVNISTILALLLQCFGITGIWLQAAAYTVIVLSILSIIITIVKRKKTLLKRNKLIKLTKERMINSTGKIVMFGGDLSWTYDYIDVITKITGDSQIVEIIFPMEKISHSKNSVKARFNKNVQMLRNAGADIFFTDKDYHLRCTLINVETGRGIEDFCVISNKRVHTDAANSNNTKYQTNVLEYANVEDRALCNSFYLNYCLIKEVYTPYKEENN